MEQETLFPDEKMREEVACIFESIDCKTQCKNCPREGVIKEKEND